MRKVLLVILDGWGHSDFEGDPDEGNAVEQATIPTFRRLFDGCPRTRLACSGRDVGLPEGQMGNSEVGHLNLGAGRIVHQDIVRVDEAVEEGTLEDHLELDRIVDHVRATNARLHVAGLVSDGGVHSHIRHFEALFDLLPPDLPVRLHCFTDGRDTSPTGGLEYVGRLAEICRSSEAWAVASVTGRYWAMDRDKRWDRTKRAYDLVARGESDHWADDPGFLEESYAEGRTDEFVEPTGIRGAGEEGIGPDDVIILMNFRADRMRQITAALAVPEFDAFDRAGPLPHEVVTMTEYEDDLPVTVAFEPADVSMGLSELLAQKRLRQLKVAETEKYAHVTYFFNGGEERPWMGEDRILIPSPRVPTYDERPEMSARPVADAVIEGLRAGNDFVLVNFANPDMVGHTGVIPAAVAAVEAVDDCLADLLECVSEDPQWVALITADHGNCEKMLDAEGNVHTAHTTEPVDFIVYDPLAGRGADEARGEGSPDGSTDATPGADASHGAPVRLLEVGRLADVAPTVLGYLGIEPPEVMTGRDLVRDR
ncbi:MAG: 2,3-bisphosphoglycerate-independent phosphoglycerate mutase [Longimicrobiales bacterium]|nr:2,3-bisphosphoglycerate-independent phosphoglycerate mutase [Longimicrobiales bacterium]